MTHDVSKIYLLDVATQKPFEAELWDTLTEQQLSDWEAQWIPELFKSLQRLHQEGMPRKFWPQSRHWDWREKTAKIKGILGKNGFSIIADGVTQAMMIVDLTKRACIKEQEKQHLVYVEYLENAPWNRKELLCGLPRFRGCGTILIRVAIELSMAEGFNGRIGLHSLPQSNNFYGNKCGMRDLGPDPDFQNLHYFEFTQEESEAFIKKGDRS